MDEKLYTKAFIKEHDKDSFTAVASTDVEDRANEIMDVSGWDLKNFKQNPVLLWGHDHMSPIGKATKIWVQKAGKPQLMFKGWISDATETARGVKRLMEEGVLRAFSVGFKPLDRDENRYTKQELLEISVVSVPANQEALMLAYKSLKGSVSEETMDKLGVPAVLLEKQNSLEAKVKELEQGLEDAVKGLTYLNPQTGRSHIAKQKATLLKAIVKAADKELSVTKSGATARRVKVIKQAADVLIRDNKGDLHG